MPKKTPDKTRKKIVELYDDGNGLSPAEISRETGVSYSTVYSMTRLLQRINPETGEQFTSQYEYKNYKAKQMGYESLNEHHEHLAKQRGFSSLSAYRKDLVKRKGFSSYSDYLEHLAKQKGFSSLSAYRKDLVKKSEYASSYDYQKQRYKKNQEKFEFQSLSSLIRRRLNELGKNQSWLAKQIGVSRKAVSSYVTCRNFPDENLLEKIYSSLDVSYKTLDDQLDNLIEEIPWCFLKSEK